MRLLDSSFVTDHAVRTLDTTQISNPPPPFVIRLLLAARRLFLFGTEVTFHRPKAVILFLADNASACEKGLMACVARLFRIKVLVFPRAGSLIGSYAANDLFAAFIRRTLGRADMFLCQGLAFQKFAIEKLGFCHESAPVIANWTARSEHLDIGANREYIQIPERVNLLFLGWLEEFKGVFDLLQAVRILRDQDAPFHLVLAGDGSARPEAERFTSQHGLSDYVTFAGWVDDVQKSDLMRACDIFVLPSWNEGLPNAMIEAMGAGLACVVTNVGNITDYAGNGREALIVEPRRHVELAEAVKSLISDHTLRATLGRNGHNLAMAQFSLEEGAKRMSASVAWLER